MITPELINRINQLAQKKRTIGLNEGETEEQAQLRKVYLAGIRAQVKSTLDQVQLVDGEALPEITIPKQHRSGGCGCGCGHKH